MKKGFLDIAIVSIIAVLLVGGIIFNSYVNQEQKLGGPTLARVPQGGTGWGRISAGLVIMGNGIGNLATSSALSFATSTDTLSLTNLNISGTCTGCGVSSFAWTPTADGNSTSTRLIFGNGFISQASSTISELTLVTDLTVANGGTGLSTFGGTNTLLYTTTADNLSSIANTTNGFILNLSGGVPTWVATTTFSTGLTYLNGTVTADLGTAIDLQSEVTDNFTDGSVLFWGTTAIAQDNTNLSFSDSLNRLTATYASSTAISGTNANFTGSIQIPFSAGLTLNSEGQIGIDTTSKDFHYFDGVLERTLVSTSTRRIFVENATSTDIISLGDFDAPVTIKKITGVLDCSGFCDVGYTFNLRHGTDRSASTTATTLFSSDRNINSTTTRVSFTGAFNDATLAAEEFLWLDGTSASTTSFDLNLNVYYTTDP